MNFVNPIQLTRRNFLVWLASLIGAMVGCTIQPTQQNVDDTAMDAATIMQPAVPSPAAFVDYAFEMRRLALANGDQAFGAIIVKDNRVVGLGPSRVIVRHDATAHAEMEALRDASRRLGIADLSGCVMYSTSRPCCMCQAAIYWARIDRMYYGAAGTDAGAPQNSC